ncbi:MAG: hypothetical protein JWL84_3179 [Rhodospirillales bacterium]|nr:hypothetical protein [Rhodospirillales bacterium]
MAEETKWKGTFAAMLVGGAAGVFLAPIVTPALARFARPATKTAIKAGLAIYQRARETAAEMRETIEDVTAELQAEAAAKPPTEAEHEPPSSESESAVAAPRRRTAVH